LKIELDLLEVASEFHQEEVLVWLLRDATVFDLELLGVFALEWKLADSVVVALNDGYRPWWNCVREVALKWRAGVQMEFVPAPEGFTSEGGWWTDVSGVTWALPGPGSGGHGPPRPSRVRRADSVSKSEWTKAMSQARLDKKSIMSVVFPPGVIAIGKSALRGLEVIESVVLPASCTVVEQSAFESCNTLKAASLPVGCKATGEHAFAECRSLVSAMIPVGCKRVSRGSFRYCISLGSVRIPEGCSLIGAGAFAESGLKEVVIPDGCRIDECAFYDCWALSKVSFGSGCASIGAGAFQECCALTMVAIGPGCSSIGRLAFFNCSRLASVLLPSTVRSIGTAGFGGVPLADGHRDPEGVQAGLASFPGVQPTCHEVLSGF
jgi:hypothetical protein